MSDFSTAFSQLGVQTTPSHMEKHIAVDFIRNTGLDPLKITKLAMMGHHRSATEAYMAFRWWADGGPFG